MQNVFCLFISNKFKNYYANECKLEKILLIQSYNNEMRKKYPKVTYLNQKEETKTNTNMEELANLKAHQIH